MNGEFKRIWRKSCGIIDAVERHFPAGIKENHEKLLTRIAGVSTEGIIVHVPNTALSLAQSARYYNMSKYYFLLPCDAMQSGKTLPTYEETCHICLEGTRCWALTTSAKLSSDNSSYLQKYTGSYIGRGGREVIFSHRSVNSGVANLCTNLPPSQIVFIKPSKLSQASTLLTCTAYGSNLGRNTSHRDRISVYFLRISRQIPGGRSSN
jgi:hypothetical protein